MSSPAWWATERPKGKYADRWQLFKHLSPQCPKLASLLWLYKSNTHGTLTAVKFTTESAMTVNSWSLTCAEMAGLCHYTQPNSFLKWMHEWVIYLLGDIFLSSISLWWSSVTMSLKNVALILSGPWQDKAQWLLCFPLQAKHVIQGYFIFSHSKGKRFTGTS